MKLIDNINSLLVRILEHEISGHHKRLGKEAQFNRKVQVHEDLQILQSEYALLISPG